MVEPTPEQAELFSNLLETLKDKSASVSFDGEKGTAIFYSGREVTSKGTYTNQQKAKDCARELPKSYTIHDTDAGKFLEEVVDKALENKQITSEQSWKLWTYGSKKMAQEAVGHAKAFTDNFVSTGGVFLNTELQTILSGASGVTSVNGVPTPLIKEAVGTDMSIPAKAQNALEMLGSKSKCFDDPPSGGSGAMLPVSSPHLPHEHHTNWGMLAAGVGVGVLSLAFPPGEAAAATLVTGALIGGVAIANPGSGEQSRNDQAKLAQTVAMLNNSAVSLQEAKNVQIPHSSVEKTRIAEIA